VRTGADFWHTPDRETGLPRHTMATVYKEMILQICRDYPGLPDFRTLKFSEIRMFYEGLRVELKKNANE
jgi:hypothetical protein